MNDRPSYELVFYPVAVRSLRKLPRNVNHRIRKAIEALQDDPRPHGATALVGSPGWLRIRIGDYRVIYEIRDGELVIVIIQAGSPQRDLPQHLGHALRAAVGRRRFGHEGAEARRGLRRPG